MVLLVGEAVEGAVAPQRGPGIAQVPLVHAALPHHLGGAVEGGPAVVVGQLRRGQLPGLQGADQPVRLPGGGARREDKAAAEQGGQAAPPEDGQQHNRPAGDEQVAPEQGGEPRPPPHALSHL